jgi:phage terminase large subunit-like protein
VVAEKNFGGALVAHAIRTANPNVPVKEVTASRGKSVRADPIAQLYEQGRVEHVEGLGELEDQCLNMSPAGYHGERSPDRVDALVWGLSELSQTGGGFSIIGVLDSDGFTEF